LAIQLVDADTTKVQLSVFAYAPAKAANMVTTLDKAALVDYVMEKIQPAITAARATGASK